MFLSCAFGSRYSEENDLGDLGVFATAAPTITPLGNATSNVIVIELFLKIKCYY